MTQTLNLLLCLRKSATRPLTSTSVDGCWTEGFPYNSLTDVGSNEQRDPTKENDSKVNLRKNSQVSSFQHKELVVS